MFDTKSLSYLNPYLHTLSSKINQYPHLIYNVNDLQYSKQHQTFYSIGNKNQTSIDRSYNSTASNNMYKQISWFTSKCKLQAFVKVVLTCIFLLFLYLCHFICQQALVLLTIFSVLFLGSNQNVFGNGLSWYWVEVSLFLNTVALTNQIILKILTYIRPSLAQTLGNNYFILIPSIIVALMLSILFVSKAIIVPNGCRTFHQCLLSYKSNVKELLINIYHIRWLLFQAYAITFMFIYIILVYLFYNEFEFVGKNYYVLFNPNIFIAQFLTFFIIVLFAHFLLYFVSQLLLWKCLKYFFMLVNQFTKIPLLLQLLKVTPSQKIHDATSLTSFKIFSLQQSRKENKLSRLRYENIVKHSLSWILLWLSNKTGKLTEKFSIYSTVSSTHINEVKYVLSYWDILCSFFNDELQKLLIELYNFKNNVEELNTLKQIQKQKLLNFQVMKKYFEVWMLATTLTRYLKICNLILQILAINGTSLNQVTGPSTNILSKVEEVNNVANKLLEVVWLNKSIRKTMEKLYNKTKRILSKNRG